MGCGASKDGGGLGPMDNDSEIWNAPSRQRTASTVEEAFATSQVMEALDETLTQGDAQGFLTIRYEISKTLGM